MGLLEEYIQQCDEIGSFEERLKLVESAGLNEHSIEAEREELQNLWAEWKIIYKRCISDPDCQKSDKAVVKSKKSSTHNCYIRCVTLIGQWKDNLKTSSFPISQKVSSSISVPPCDTQVFYGDYVNWPSFRDLFTAIYVNNKKLSPVEKLYHLFQKTDGEAREINRNIPLTSEGFDIAWGNLRNQYENKRILINNQLRTLFNLPQCTQESAHGLKKLQREITNCISVLRLYKIDIGSWDPIFVFQCSAKLPKLTLSLWEQSISNKTELPKWEELDRFLTERFQALESVSDIRGFNDSVPRQKYTNNNDRSKQYKVHHTKVNSIKCSVCKGSHKLQSCPKFLSMEFKNRISIVRRDRNCMNCLGPGHIAAECQSKSVCAKCGIKHHTLLHKEKVVGDQTNSGTNIRSMPTPVPNIQSADQPSTSHNVQTYHTSVSSKTMLATAWVRIVNNGLSQRVRALIDPCSDDTFISSRIQKLFKLSTKPISADISGLGGEHLTKCSEIAVFTLRSIKTNFSAEIEALVVPDVTGDVPTHSFYDINPENIPRLEFADPDFYKSAPVDILIGGNLYPMILLKGVEHGILGSLVAQETVFGWIVTGPSNSGSSKRLVRVSHCTRVSINEQMAKFWEIEEIPNKVSVTEEDTICEEIYRTTTLRDSSGRYIVDLPFKAEPSPSLKLGSSRYIALSQFLRNEKSLSQKPDLKHMYDDVIREYLMLGHMKLVKSSNNSSESGFYLPHHGVYKPESTTTKLRVVFNGSCPSSNGKSLNDYLYTGPVLQRDIVSLILNWRLYKLVFNADISKMYRQILVNPNHAPFQRILYRTSSEEEIQDFQLMTVTFGLNCAPYLALRTLLKLADDEEQKYPIGARILRENMYVDDALVGIHSVSEGLEAKKQFSAILRSAGFELRKWASNSKDILRDLPRDHLLNDEFLSFDDKSTAKTLGIRWNAVSDCFYFVTEKLQCKDSFTKREVLSVIARLFDPLGWLAPVVIAAKILMQQLWLDDIGWDDPLKPLTLLKWKSFIHKYHDIDSITIPRWVHYSPDCEVEFHGFCDSSQLAYAAVLYARVKMGNQTFSSILVSKTKVAPIKRVSLPRLELCGALLLSELVHIFLPQVRVSGKPLYLWSDSTIVLAWLKKPSHNWTTFVANRVAKIQEKVGSCWRHVSTHENPADLATRGLSPLELKETNLWWHGPHWLQNDSLLFPSNVNIPDTNIEAKPHQSHIARSSESEDFLDRFSCLSRAIHVVAYIVRFAHSARTRGSKSGHIRLTAEELKYARNKLILLSQKRFFANEYLCLTQKKPLDSRSSLLTLTPFLDKDQIIRANGRLGSTFSLSYSERHPIILSPQSRFAKLYVAFIHKLTLHGGIQLMMATVRLECWIIRGKNLIRAHFRNCKECIMSRKRLQGQLMAALPPERTTFSRPFTNTGVDYAGPFDLKTFSGRGSRLTKGYVCLFVCFATRAIHLEAVSDLSTAAFMAALTRFVSRRGCPNRIYSDNGRNFIGAARELRQSFCQVIAELKNDTVSRYGQHRLEWHFIPASSPHMGGLWEAGVKSCKGHLKKISGQIRHTFEEFSTILSSIESCLNSRPLTQMSEDIDDLTALTPAHFLIGASLLAPAEPEVLPSRTNLLNRWRKLKIVQQDFCRRWKTDYLKELQKRNKWKRPQRNLQLNDLVVLHIDTGLSNDWRLGRVTKLYPGSDGNVRVVDVRTQAGVITRPVHKLVLLPQQIV